MNCTLQQLLALHSVRRRLPAGDDPVRHGSCTTEDSDAVLTDDQLVGGPSDAEPAGISILLSEEKEKLTGDDKLRCEYLPSSCLNGKYVLLYLTAPLGDSVVSEGSEFVPRPVDFPSLAQPPTPTSTLGTTTACASGVSSLRTSGADVVGSSQHGLPNTAVGASPCRVSTLLSRFCMSVVQQLRVSSGLAFPIAVLEVRQRAGVEASSDLPWCLKAKNKLTATLPCFAIGASNGTPLTGMQPPGTCADELPSGGKVSHDLQVAVDSSFGGWFYLESTAIYRRIIHGYELSSWPAVLLFSPEGKLLTVNALDHLEREMSSLGTCEEPVVSAAGECGLWQTAESVEVRSDFPWVVVGGDDAKGSGTNNSDDVEEELPVQTFLKDLIGCSRRVGHVCEVGMDLLSSGSCDHVGQCQINARFDGAGYLTFCFGSGWHPASKHFLTRLKRLWLAAKGAPVSEKEDECESGREDSCDVREALCWRLGNSDLNAFTAGAGGFCGSLGIDSWGNEAVSDAYTSLGVLEADSHGAVSRSFPEIPLDLPRNELVFSQSPVEVVPDLHASASVTQDEVKVAKQQSKPHQFQVLFVSCDFEEAQMKSLLCSMPTSWLCVSPLFGPQSQRLVKACVEFFNVRVFPRLISVKVSRPLLTPSGDDHGEPVEGSVANARFSVVHMHGERLVLRGDGVERLFSECEYEDIACSKAADATTRGGVFFGTCSVAGPCRPPFPRLPSQGTLVQSQLKPVIESLLAEGGSLFALCCIGSISSGVYKECAGALHEAAAWWYEESQRHTDNVSMCDTCTCLLEKATRGVTTEALCATAEGVVDPESGGDRHTQRQPSDQFAQCADMGQKFCATACPLGSTLEDFPSACPLQSPVYFVDAISRVRARAGGDVARPVEEGVSNCSAAQHCAGDGLTMEDELLLQEHIISEVLEASEHLLPSTEGEPFLVYLRWPERQVDVLRRMQDVELPAATVVSVGSTRNTTQPLGPAVEAVGLHSEVPAACHEPDEPPAETSHDSPLCSPSLVKSFILRCHMKRGGNRATSLC